MSWEGTWWQTFLYSNTVRGSKDVIVYISLFQELGYKGEIGYQTFLYSNEAEVRRVFMFLIEKLPKEASEAVEEVLGRWIKPSKPYEIHEPILTPNSVWNRSNFSKSISGPLEWPINNRSCVHGFPCRHYYLP